MRAVDDINERLVYKKRVETIVVLGEIISVQVVVVEKEFEGLNQLARVTPRLDE